MANKNLLTANQMYVDQQSFDVGGEITKQFDNVMKGYNDFKVQLNEDATTVAEGLSADAIGVDLMSDESQDWITGEFDRIGMEIAKARASGNKNLVRKLEMEGADLIGVQSELGNLLKEHAENKLAGNYSTSADQDMLDMLMTKQYTIGRNSAGKIVINFNKDVDQYLTGKFNDPVEQEAEIKRIQTAINNAEGPQEREALRKELEQAKGKGFAKDWQEEGILLSDLDKHIRVKDDSQGDDYSGLLDELAKQSQKGIEFNVSKDKTQKIVNAATETTDQLQTAIFDETFMQDGKTLAELWTEDLKAGNIILGKDLNNEDIILDPNSDPNKYLKSNGSKYKAYEAQLKDWTRNKLMTAAQNHHTNNAQTYQQMSMSERKTQNSVNKINDFLDGGQDSNSLLTLGDSTTNFSVFTGDGTKGTQEGVEYYAIKKWSNGDWVTYKNVRKDTEEYVLRQIFQQALGQEEEIQ